MSEPPPRRWVDRLTTPRALSRTAALAALVSVALFAYLGHLRPPLSHLWGDEGTYVGMTASLARDLDLEFTQADREWALERREGKGVAVILQRAGERVTYSKPLLYPLLAALPYKLAGEVGMIALNAVALACGLFFLWLHLRRVGSGGRLWLTLVIFAGYAAVAPYLVWRMSEALQVGLSATGLVLACGGARRRDADRGGLVVDGWLDHRLAPWIGGAALAALVTMRTSNLILLAAAVAVAALAGERRRALAVVGGAVAAALVLLGASQLFLGTASPYTAERSSFNAQIGYPAGPESELALRRFDERPATHRLRFEWRQESLYSAYYFLAGRHTGLLAYFPPALLLAWTLLRRPSRRGLVLLAATLGMSLFYLLYMPYNYFGGSTFVGNRYFLVAYPALLVGLTSLPAPRALLAVLLWGLLLGASATQSVRQSHDLDSSSQSHASAGLFRRLPYESTAVEIQGHKSRFWSQDYVRFTDGYADVERNRFVLNSARPHAELMIASKLPRDTMVFLVRPTEVMRALDWKDWARSGWEPLDANPRTRNGVVTFRPATPWRRHRFWFANDDLYDVRLVQVKLWAELGEERQAQVYYLGNDQDILNSAQNVVLGRRLPRRGLAGGRARASVRVRNASENAWSPSAVTPVLIGYQVFDRQGTAVTQAKRPIPGVVRPQEEVTLELEIEWPSRPGRYRLVIDLWLHPVYAFRERLRRPLAAGPVQIRPSGQEGEGDGEAAQR